MQTMENYQGDLTDIVRASGGSSSIPPSHDDNEPISSSGGHWKFPSSDLMNFRLGIEEATDDFGDPFSDMRDPLLHELSLGGASSSSSFFFNTQNSSSSSHVDDHHDQAESSVFGVAQETINLDDQMMKRRPTPCNIFSRMLQISPNSKTKTTTATLTVSPCDSPVQLQATASPMGSIINANSLSKGCIVDSTAGLQIGSPRNPGIKRRKSQAKKVVCIPAPAPANSRPSGEIVPSDLWAWRKYGQKPIKGSPYPRGYYRCSSSKGCSARKQVERSRTDPNMLVITYTSEHNHPWPTQRNALAGSTRAQPSKHNINAASQSQKTTNLNEEFKGRNKDINISSSVAGSSASVKEEMEDIDEKELDMDEGDQFSEGYPPSYKPTMPDSNLQPADQDFFADLDEIEDPLSLLLNQGFRSGDNDQAREIKALDPFSIFDCWSENSSNNTSYGEAKRGL